MKKAIYLLAVLIIPAVIGKVHAQCVPNTVQNIFLIPDTATDFPPAYTYMPYDEVLYIAVPTDTSILGFPFTIDSIVLVNITGLPACISYSATPSSGIFPGGSKACIQFTGTPATSDIGTYPIVINSLVSGTIVVIDTTIAVPWQGYTIRVLDSSNFGIQIPEAHYSFSVYQNSPNPCDGLTEIGFMSQGNENISLQIFDILGTKVFDKNVVSVKGYNPVYFNATGYSSGMYFYRVSNGKVTFSRRMIVASH